MPDRDEAINPVPAEARGEYTARGPEGEELLTVECDGDRRVCVSWGEDDLDFVCLNREQWQAIVETTRPVWGPA